MTSVNPEISCFGWGSGPALFGLARFYCTLPPMWLLGLAKGRCNGLELCSRRISCFHAFWCFSQPILAIFHIANYIRILYTCMSEREALLSVRWQIHAHLCRCEANNNSAVISTLIFYRTRTTYLITNNTSYIQTIMAAHPDTWRDFTVRVENFEVFLISRFLWVADDTKIIHVEGGINTHEIFGNILKFSTVLHWYLCGAISSH